MSRIARSGEKAPADGRFRTFLSGEAIPHCGEVP